MRITLCGSVIFIEAMKMLKHELTAQGHEVQMPPEVVRDGQGCEIHVTEFYRLRQAESALASDGEVGAPTSPNAWIWERKAQAMRTHFEKVAWAELVIVTNYTKNGVRDYIGANTLMEMGLAFHLRIPIILLNTVPDIPAREEILGMRPYVLGTGHAGSLKDMVAVVGAMKQTKGFEPEHKGPPSEGAIARRVMGG